MPLVNQSLYVTTCDRCGEELRTTDIKTACKKCGLQIEIDWQGQGQPK